MRIMISDEADEVIKKSFDSLENRYQNYSYLIRGNEIVFNCVLLLYYKCHKINVNCGGSYTDFLNQIKNKEATINPINKKENKYAVTVVLNFDKIGKHA